MKKSIFSALCLVLLATTTQSAWGAEPTVLYHEGFGDNSNSARNWKDTYKEQSGVSAVYSSASYTITNAKQSKNTVGSTSSGLIQTTKGTDAVFIVGPLNVANYTTLQVTYKWNAVSIKGTYETSLAYATASNGAYTNVTKTSGTGATTFVDVKYDLPAAAQVSTLYLKVIVNTSNAQAVLDELELTGIAGSTGTTPSVEQHPEDATYDQGAKPAALTITASGNPTPTYQWYSNTSKSNSNGTAISGATGASYTPSTATAGTFYYYCVATNSEGSASSNVATITVNPVTTYTVQWKVGGNVYTTGYPTTSVASGSKVSTLPTAPAGNAIGSCANTFMGWSTHDLGSGTGQVDPGDLFTTIEGSPAITANTPFYAVFATKTNSGSPSYSDVEHSVSYTDFSGEGASGGGTSFNKAIDGITYNSTSGYGNTSYVQLYSSSELTISSQNVIKSIVITTSANNNNNYSASKISLKSGQNGSYTAGASGTNTGTWIANSTDTKSVTFSMSAQVRMTKVVVTTYDQTGGGTTYSDYVTKCVECTANTLSLTATETTVNLPETGGVDVNIASFVTIGNNTTDAVTYSGDGVNSSTGAFHANAKGDYVINISQPLGTGNPVICDVSKTFTVHVLATPVITLVAVPDAPITLTADCGQTTTATVQVTAYNCGTNNVTIKSSDTHVTVSPASFTPTDGKVNDVVTLSYTASKGDDESYTAEISATCDNTAGQNTISVTATKGNCTPSVLTFMDRGSQYKQINSHYAGEQLQASEVPVPTGVCTQPVEYIFDGWATAKVANGAPSYEKVDFSSYVINGDQTFYAVYKYVEEGGGDGLYHLVTDVAELQIGSSIVIAASASNYAISTTQNDNNRGQAAITKNDTEKTLSFDNTAGVQELTLKEGTTTGTYAFYTGSGYLYAASSSKNYLRTATTLSANSSWNITITSGGVATCQAQGTNTRNLLQYNSSNSFFSCYGSDQNAIAIYQLSAGTTYYTSSPACGPYVQIVGSKDIYVTSGNVGGRKTVQAQDTIRFTSGSLAGKDANAPTIKVPPTDITINGTKTNIVEVEFKDSICTKNGDGTYSITGGIVVKYKPTNSNATENIKVKLRAEYNTGKNVVLDSFMVHARSLPEKFVITAKGTDGKWYALPADMSGSSPQPANGQLVVDNTASPAKATITPCNTIYKFDGQKQGGDLRYVRFVGLDGKYLWAATKGNTGNTGIKNDAKDPAAADAPYNWLLTSADNVTYTFANQNTDRTLRLSGTKFGMYDAKNGVNELRILPIDEKDTCAYNAAPQNITLVSKTSTTVTLAWAAVPGAERYQYNVGTIWNDCTVDDLDYPQATITGLGTGATVTIALRAVHGNAAKICSDTAQITVTTANCDDVPTISGTINGNSSCGTLTLTATGVTASSDALCPITQYGFQYTQDTTTWATYEQTEHSSLPVSSSINDPVTVSRGGKYYVRLYAVNEVGTGYSAVKTIDVSGLANLQIITAGDATTAPMISGKATLRIGAVSDSPSPITWQVFDGSNAEQTTIAAGIANNGVFSTTAFGVYRVVAKQAADPTYCADSATIYIEVRLPNHYGYVTNCAVLNNNNLEVINVSSSEITFGIDDADVVQIEIVKENTGNTSTGGGGQANDLFISKYFEATGSVKLIAIFNGTNEEIDLSNYTVKIGRVNDKGTASWAHTLNLSAYGKTIGKIASGEEIILYSQGQYPNCSSSSKADCEITKCVLDNKVFDFNSGYKENVKINFSGVQSVVLCKNEVPIDILGSITNATKDGLPMKVTESPSWGDANGWVGYGPNIDNESEMIPISTNRCLLIRRNTVVDGSKTLTQNINSRFNTLGTYNRSTPSSSIEGEWAGLQIPENDVYNDDGVTASCHGFEFVGSFDYAEYFQRYEPVTGKIDLVNLVDNHDGSWSLPTSSFAGTAWEGKNFHDLACTSVKINGYQKIGLKDSLITALNYKVPIIVDRTTTTDDADLFGFEGDGRIICPECDVVIRDNEKLSVVPAGYNNIRNMWVYSGAALNIQDDKTYNMGKLTIESENNEVGYALIKGTLNAQDGISHTKRIDANAWYDFSLPYNCKVSDIVRTNGKTLGLYSVNAGDLAKNDTARWVIKYYDGQKRAISGTPNGAAPTNWAVVPADGILEAGVGYIVALGGTHNANPNYKVRFVLPNRSTQPYVESVNDNRTKGVKGYTGPKAEELPCHKGWNYLGNPYVSRFDGNLQDPVWQTAYTGLLLNGFYTDLLTGNSYDVIEYPDLYVAVDMGEGGATNWVQTKASLALLSPFRAFMIQAVSDGDVDFNKEARNLPQGQAPSVRSVNTERETISAVRLNIDHDTYGTGSTDIMLHSLYTDKYDLGYDMVRMFNSRPAAQPFTLNSTADYLLYNAANRDLAETADIPVGIRTLAAGTYTFSLAPLTGTDRYAAIYLIDRDENDLKIDLLQGNYTTMLARETNTSRFALRFEKRAQLPTDIDNDAIQSPIIYRDQTDIVIDNLPTDATVRVVDAIGRTLYMQQADAQIVRFHAPARGAYIIQVMTQQGNFSIKTIL